MKDLFNPTLKLQPNQNSATPLPASPLTTKSEARNYPRLSYAFFILNFLSLSLGQGSIWANPSGDYRFFDFDTGGWTTGIKIHSGGRLYARTDVGGVYRSDDHGASWQWLGGHPALHGAAPVQGIAISPANPDILFIGTGTDSAPTDPYRGIWRSMDGGATWTQVLPSVNFSGNGEDNAPAASRWGGPCIVFDENDPTSTTIWAGTRNGLWRSLDSGDNWSQVGSFNNPIVAVHLPSTPTRTGEIWVGGHHHLAVSINGGDSWTFFQGWKHVYGIVTLADDSNDSNLNGEVLVAGMDYSNQDKLVRISATNWHQPQYFQVENVPLTFGGTGTLPLLAILNQGTRLVVGRNDGAPPHWSADGGRSWTAMSEFTVPEPGQVWRKPNEDWLPYGRNRMVQDPQNPNRLYLATGFGPFISTDFGESWTYSGTGIGEVVPGKAVFHPSDTNLVAIPAADINAIVITDGGKSGRAAYSIRAKTEFWPNSTWNSLAFLFTESRWISFGNYFGNSPQIVISENEGSDWIVYNRRSGQDAPKSFYNRLNGLPDWQPIVGAVVSPADENDILVLSGIFADQGGVYRSLDGGMNWHRTQYNSGGIFGNDFHGYNNFYADTRPDKWHIRYLFANGAAPHRSVDNGETWTALPRPMGWREWGSIVMNRERPGELWAAMSLDGSHTEYMGLYKLTDASIEGLSNSDWIQMGDFTMEHTHLHPAPIDAVGDFVVLYGRRPGDNLARIYISNDSGQSWEVLPGSDGKFNTVTALALDPHRPGSVWISSAGRSVTAYFPSGTSWQDCDPEDDSLSLWLNSLPEQIRSIHDTINGTDLPNGIRYAMGMEPLSVDSSKQPQLQKLSNGNIALTYSQRVDLVGTLEVVWSTNPFSGPWQVAETIELALEDSYYSFQAIGPGPLPVFFRLRYCR
ncbi:MAG: hypothetical protein LR015_10445 [Verrucomicrobia bacterium]|nr:hypothetical protein [Verrucomicrobiota bacterium]